jgi:hypothetical protein
MLDFAIIFFYQKKTSSRGKLQVETLGLGSRGFGCGGLAGHGKVLINGKLVKYCLTNTNVKSSDLSLRGYWIHKMRPISVLLLLLATGTSSAFLLCPPAAVHLLKSRPGCQAHKKLRSDPGFLAAPRTLPRTLCMSSKSAKSSNDKNRNQIERMWGATRL